MRQEAIKNYSPNFYPKQGAEKESKLSPSLKKLIASVAILGVLGALTYVGVKSMGNKEASVGVPENPVEEQIPAATQEQNIDSTAINTQTESLIHAICKDTSDCAKQQEIADKYSESLLKYKNMSVTEFEKLPDNERLAYGDFLADINNAYDGRYKEGSTAYEYRVSPKKLSLESSGQEMLDNYLYRIQLTRLQTDIDKSQPAEDMFFFNKDNSVKLLNSTYVMNVLTIDDKPATVTNSNSYKSQKNSLEKREESTWMNDKYIEQESFKTIDVNRNTASRQQKLVGYKDENGENLYAVFEYTNYKSYDSSERSTWLLNEKYNSLDDVPKFYLKK